MAQSKILVDTNCYIRLTKSIRPLLFQTFGEVEHCLYVLPELNRELENNKLKSKFHWLNENEYSENRNHFPTISRKQKSAISQTFDHLWDYVQSDHPGPSKVDVRYIAFSLELRIPVVTDDQDMVQLARVFETETMPTMQLLRLMLDCEHIKMKTIKGLIAHWRHITDLPANFVADLRRFFPEI